MSTSRATGFFRGLLKLAGPILAAVILIRSLTFLVEVAHQKNLTSLDLAWDTQLTKKLKVLLNSEQEFNGFFVGSSTLAQVNPAVIDTALAQAGVRSRSYNFSLGATSLSELYVGFKTLVESKKLKLDWIVFDVSTPQRNSARVVDQNDQREIYQHSLEEVLFLSKYKMGKPAELLDHWSWYLRRLGTPRYDGDYRFNQSIKSDFAFNWVYDFQRGFLKFSDLEKVEPYRSLQLNNDFQRFGENNYRQKLKRILSSPKTACDPYTVGMFERFVSLAKEVNPEIKIIFLNPPVTVKSWVNSCDFYSAFNSYEYFNLQLPEEYPELFRFEDRVDDNHLRDRALGNLEKILGQKLAAALALNNSPK